MSNKWFLLHCFLLSAALTIIMAGKTASNSGTSSKTARVGHHYDYDTIVVGGGIIGSGIAYKLASVYNKKTLILEKGKKAHKDGSSHGGSRILRHTHTSSNWLPMAKDAYREWNELQKRHGETILRVNGVITLDFEEAMTDKRAKILNEAKIEYKKLVGKKIGEEFPHLQNYAEGKWSAIYEPGGVTLLADKCLEAIQKQFLETKHGTINFGEEVVKWGPQNDGVGVWVETKGHRYTAKNVVFAVGGWLSKQVPDLPVKTKPYLKGSLYWDVKNEEHQKFFDPDFKAAEHKTNGPKHPSPSLCIWPSRKDEESMYAIPEEKTQIKFCTSYGEEIKGEIKSNDKRKILESTIKEPKEHIAKHLPWVDAEKGPAENSVTCITTVTNDGQWIVDEHPKYRGKVYIAGGFCGTGFKYALTVGNFLAQKITGVKRPKLPGDTPGTHIDIDMNKFSLDLKRRAVEPKTMEPNEE